jgi:hypothetical protein
MNHQRLLTGCAAMLLALVAAADDTDVPVYVGAPKLGAPIGIDAQLDGEPAVGQPLTVTLSIGAGVAVQNVVLSLAADAALAITSPQGDVDLGAIAAGDAATVDVVIVPLAGGTSHLRVAVSADIRGRRQSATQSVPLRLPADTLQPSAITEAGKSEASVRSLQAIEDIR